MTSLGSWTSEARRSLKRIDARTCRTNLMRCVTTSGT